MVRHQPDTNALLRCQTIEWTHPVTFVRDRLEILGSVMVAYAPRLTTPRRRLRPTGAQSCLAIIDAAYPPNLLERRMRGTFPATAISEDRQYTIP